MRALLTSHGSTGDIYPVIALGKRLHEAGHSVAFASAPFFREEIEAAGLSYLYLPPDWGKAEYADAMLKLWEARHPLAQLRYIYESAQPFMLEYMQRLDSYMPGVDLLVSSYLFPQLKFVAERHQVPFVVTTFCHNVVPSNIYPPDPFPRLAGLPRALNATWSKSLWWVAEKILDRVLNNATREIREAQGFPQFKGFCSAPADLALVCVSEKLMRPPLLEASEFYRFSGYLRHQPPFTEKAAAVLDAFLGDKDAKAPVLTFGSVTFDEPEKKLEAFLQTWPTDKKLILQSGWIGLKPARPMPNVLVIDKMSHDQLFSRASCVIHHGGAGTTASALHSGAPQIVIPHIADQNFWADEVVRLGAGIKLACRKWPTELAKTVSLVETNPTIQKAAGHCASELQTEDGPQRAVELLEALVTGFEKR